MAFLLSELLSDLMTYENFRFINERYFTYLSLAHVKLDNDTCTFVDDEKYIDTIADNVKMIITTLKISGLLDSSKYGICVCEKPRIIYFELHNYLSNKKGYTRPTYVTQIGSNCRIHESAFIATTNVTIGNNVVIEEFASIKENTVIGDNSIIRAGARIGGQGFEFKRDRDATFAVCHIGGVIIKENVEIQYNTCVDKGIYPWDDTIIEEYSRIDNLVYIAHGVKIGKRALIVANAVIGGRVVIGDDVWVGFSATIRNGLIVGNQCRVNMGAVVTKSLADNHEVTGNFAIDHMKFLDNLKKTI